MEQVMNYLDRNEFNFEPSQKVVDAIKRFDPKTLCFYTRIYDQGKKSVISVRLSEIYGIPEEQVLLTYGGEDMLKNAIHYFLMVGDNKKILIPEFSWWYYNRVASECGGTFEGRYLCLRHRRGHRIYKSRSSPHAVACIAQQPHGQWSDI